MLRSIYLSAMLGAILLAASAGERIGQGEETNENEWSYEWYEGEPFMLYCNTKKLNVTDTDYIRWEKPSKDGETYFLDKDHNDDNYQTNSYFGVNAYQLQIKKITSATSGVYICRVHASDTGIVRAHTILGINIRDHKYDVMFDKYRSHLIVAVIATAVFLIPFATICVTYHFRYERRHHDRTARYTVNGRENERKTPVEKGASYEYENPTFAKETSASSTNF